MKKYITHSAAETENFAADFARTLRPGDVIAYVGGLGAGKTAFTRGLAKTLAPDAEVSSPTFALVNDYGGEILFWHFDMYRISSMEDLYSTGFFDYLEMGGILAVEWSENIPDALPEGTIYIRLRPIGETDREILIGESVEDVTEEVDL